MILTDIACRLNQVHGTSLPPGFFITDSDAVPEPEQVIGRLPPGFGVILRDYDHPRRPQLAQSLATICQKRKLIFLVAGDSELAARVGADGIHLPEGLMGDAVLIRAHHPHWLITASCHGMSAVQKAATLPLDGALIAPVFPTRSHPETFTGKNLGVDEVERLVKVSDLPLYALGGITCENAAQLSDSGIAGIAAIRGFAEN